MDVTRENRIRNEYIRGSVGVASIMDKTRENRRRWSCYEGRSVGSSKYCYGNEYGGKKRKSKEVNRIEEGI